LVVIVNLIVIAQVDELDIGYKSQLVTVKLLLTLFASSFTHCL